MVDVIVTDSKFPVGAFVAKCLERRGLKVCCPELPPAIQEEPAYIRALLSCQQETGARMIIPLFFPEILAAHRDEFPQEVIVPLDSFDTLRLLDNKSSACTLASRLGILQPRHYSSLEEIDRWPVVFKRDEGLGGAGVYFPDKPSALANLIAKAGSEPYSISEFIDGEDWCVDALRWGNHFEAGSYRVLLPRQKGASVLRESVDAPWLVETARMLLDSVGYRGVCGIDCRRSFADGKFYFLECNPRFSGGIFSQVVSGLDLPWHLWQVANGIEPDGYELKTGVLTLSRSAMDSYLEKRRAKGWLQEDSEI